MDVLPYVHVVKHNLLLDACNQAYMIALHGKPAQEHGKLVLGHDKLVLGHDKLALGHGKLVLGHDKLALEHGKLALEHGKLVLGHGKLVCVVQRFLPVTHHELALGSQTQDDHNDYHGLLVAP